MFIVFLNRIEGEFFKTLTHIFPLIVPTFIQILIFKNFKYT